MVIKIIVHRPGPDGFFGIMMVIRNLHQATVEHTVSEWVNFLCNLYQEMGPNTFWISDHSHQVYRPKGIYMDILIY